MLTWLGPYFQFFPFFLVLTKERGWGYEAWSSYWVKFNFLTKCTRFLAFTPVPDFPSIPLLTAPAVFNILLYGGNIPLFFWLASRQKVTYFLPELGKPTVTVEVFHCLCAPGVDVLEHTESVKTLVGAMVFHFVVHFPQLAYYDSRPPLPEPPANISKVI